MNHLSGTASAEELLYHAVWWFVQQIGALTSNALFEATRVALGGSGDLYQGLLCGAQSTNGSTKDPRLTGLEHYTGTQVFFMTACLGLCEEDASGRHWSSECNAAARNYAPFAEAFHCSTDTPMNPKEKCRLLKS
ncbi:uncharacterized protein [Dermacentor andersoni]|uniref:uncharacterized protein n=1 Tax=Dermacentor andersoni TaxID=34620 RepID=UPI003B3B87E7